MQGLYDRKGMRETLGVLLVGSVSQLVGVYTVLENRDTERPRRTGATRQCHQGWATSSSLAMR